MRSTGISGAVSEMVACVDLLRRGFEVFRAVAPACECDLIALRAGRCWRVEVRTAQQSPVSGLLACPLQEHDRGRFDVLATVLGDRVAYLPESFTGETFPWPVTPAFWTRAHDYTGTPPP